MHIIFLRKGAATNRGLSGGEVDPRRENSNPRRSRANATTLSAGHHQPSDRDTQPHPLKQLDITDAKCQLTRPTPTSLLFSIFMLMPTMDWLPSSISKLKSAPEKKTYRWSQFWRMLNACPNQPKLFNPAAGLID